MQTDIRFTGHAAGNMQLVNLMRRSYRRRCAQAQKQGAVKPASAFKLQEAEGMEDLLSLMHSMSVAGATPQANGDLTGHAHAPAGTPCLCSPFTQSHTAVYT